MCTVEYISKTELQDVQKSIQGDTLLIEVKAKAVSFSDKMGHSYIKQVIR